MIRKLSNGKTPGLVRITYEHLKHGGDLVKMLLRFFHGIIETEEIPAQMKLAIKIPILKGSTIIEALICLQAIIKFRRELLYLD